MRLDIKVRSHARGARVGTWHGGQYGLQLRSRGIDQIADGIGVLQRQLFARSERVKGIDFHPTEPWVSYCDGLRLK